MAGRHKQAVAQRATKTHIRAALGQVNMANRQALRIEDPPPIELFRPRIGSAIAPPTSPNVAILVHSNAIQRARPLGVNHQALARQLP